jgi:1,4-dihydroxy-2-naphthoyl-CoA hydrolase
MSSRAKRFVGYRGAAMAPPTVEQLNEAVTGYDRLYGLRFVAFGDAEVKAEVQVRDEVRQPLGLVHGGLYASVAESITSLGTAAAVIEEGLAATGMSNSTSFLHPITEGTVHASATRLHRGRTTWVWDVTFTDDAGRTCAVTRMTIAVRPAREPGKSAGGEPDGVGGVFNPADGADWESERAAGGSCSQCSAAARAAGSRGSPGS